MDLQTILDNAVAAERAESMKTSPQLTLGELILKLEATATDQWPVIFDVAPWFPTHAGSWRGSYRELALDWTDKGKPMSLSSFLSMLRDCIGAVMTGYKGGDYLMGKTTPVWVANYGDSEGFGAEEEIGVIDVRLDASHVVLVTAPCELWRGA